MVRLGIAICTGVGTRRRGLALAAFAVIVGASAATAGQSSSSSWTDFDHVIVRTQQSMMADPAKALAGARQAERIARENRTSARFDEALATSLWLEAEAFYRINHISEAQTAVTAASKLAAADGKLTKLDGDLALTRARIADARGDFAVALKNFQEAHTIFAKLGIPRYQAMSLLGLGNIYEKARDFDRVVRYYQKASQVYAGDPAFALSVTNNVGFALQQTGRYAEAIDNYNRALEMAVQLKSPMLEGRILTNLAMAYAKSHRLAEGERAADKALATLGPKDEGDWAPFAWSVKADIAYQRRDIHRAVGDLDKAFHGVDLSTTIAPFRDAHEIAFKVYRAAGNFPLALAHLEAFKRLDDEGRSVAASANLALMGAQFDFASQQLEIAQLKSAELERDIKLRASMAATQRVAFVAIVLAGFIFLAWIAWRHALLSRHRKLVGQKNVQLTRTLAERDQEIVRRTEVEAQLRDAMEAAQQANRAKSHFLANMSHELRTPLNAIIGFSELIMGRDMGREKTTEYASNIALGGRNLLSVLTEILDMARIEAGRVALSEDTVRLGSVIDDARASQDPTAAKRIRYDRAHDGLLLIADPARLQQALSNLLSNAIKFSGDHGFVDVSTEVGTDGLDIVVHDEGPGISADKLATIMEPFGQAEGPYARAHGGAGLGLPIVKGLVEMHGGTLAIGPARQGGTEARVHLPADRILDIESQPEAEIGTAVA